MSALEEYFDRTDYFDRTANRRILNAQSSSIFHVMDAADAAIAELEAKLIKWVDLCYEEQQRAERAEAERDKFADVLHKTNAEWEKDILRANEAEAENERLMRDFTHTDELWEEEAHDLDNTIAKLEAERDKLKVCGNCAYIHTYDAGEPGCQLKVTLYNRLTDPCHFDPSRWTPYWGES